MKNQYLPLFVLNVAAIGLNATNMFINLFQGKYVLALIYLFTVAVFAICGHGWRQNYFEKRKEIKKMKSDIFEHQLMTQKKKELHEKFAQF